MVRWCALRDELGDDLAAELAELFEAAGVVVGESVVVQAEQFKDRAMHVADVMHFVHGQHAHLVGRTDGVTGFNAATGEPHGHGVGVVVAAISHATAHTVVGGAAEFSTPDHERAFE